MTAPARSRSALIVSPVFPSRLYPERGSFVDALAVELGRQNIDVDVIVPTSLARGLSDGPRVPHGQTANRWPHVRHARAWMWPERLFGNGPRIRRWNHSSAVRATRRALGRIGRRYDFVYAHFLISGIAASPWCLRHGIPYVVAAGESDIRTSYEGVVDREDLGAAIRGAAAVVAPSEENLEFCRELAGGAASRCVFVPNGIDPGRFPPRARDDARRELGLPADVGIVIFVGHFIARKAPLDVLAAIRGIEGAAGVFLGRGSETPGGEGLLFAGPVPPARIPAWLAAADVFALPSHGEGMSNAVLEALASGLPVVVSDRPFNRAFLDEKVARFVEPGDVAGLTSTLRALLADADRRMAMESCARELAQQYTIEHRARRIVELALAEPSTA